jgi:hypothetical protein
MHHRHHPTNKRPGYIAYLAVSAAAAAGCYLGYRAGRRRVA